MQQRVSMLQGRGSAAFKFNIMLILLINLERRPDRLAFMTAQLSELGLPFQRIEAIDGLSSDFGPATHALTGIERACALSHRKAWQYFLESGHSHCLILEDDVFLSPALKSFVFDASNVPPDVELLRLETRLMRTRLSLPVRYRTRGGFKIHRMYSTHYGCAAYIVSRAFAGAAVRDLTDFGVPLDHILFEPKESCFYPEAVYQLRPALCIQAELLAPARDTAIAASDLQAARVERLRSRRAEARKVKLSIPVKCWREISRWAHRVGAMRGAAHECIATRSVWREIPFAGPALTVAHAAISVS